MTGDRTVVRIDATDTHDLRRRVLRSGISNTVLVWPGDDEVTTLHLGIRDEHGAVVAISTWLARPAPNGEVATQLRGMATDPERLGRGLAGALLVAGASAATSRGHHVVWANARVSALGFYERAGWTAQGPVFHTADTGLPHRVVTRRLDNT